MVGLKIARRYASALLAIGKEDGQAESYKKELAGFVRLLNEQKEFEQALSNPLYEQEDRKNVLKEVLGRLDVSEIMKSFLSVVFDKGRIRYLRDICTCYEKLIDELAGVVRAHLVSAVDLTEETVQKIETALSKKTSKKVKLEITVDHALIGGVVTKIGDLVLDGSIKTQLLSLKESLQRGESI